MGDISGSRRIGANPVDEEIVQSNENTREKLVGGITGKGFMPGKTGNPGGRPKKRAITDLYDEILRDPAAMDMLRKAVVKSLKGGNMAMVLQLKEMADRTEGKVVQPIEADVTVSLPDAIAEARKRAGK